MGSQIQYSVLIVDDQPASTMVLATLLERRGFKCHFAANAEEAFQKLEEVLPHLLIIDVQLGPDSSGIDWLMEVRKQKFSFVPAVMLTGSSDETTVRDSLAAGIYDYIIKPCRPAVLEKKILAWRECLAASLGYSWNQNESNSTVEASIKLKIAAISETGICVDGSISNSEPVTFTKLSSSLFNQIDLSPPQKITFLNFEKKPGGGSAQAIRNFCQVSGWMEPDFKRIRLWIRSNFLGRSF